jgi:kynurenine formamidase
VGAQRIDPAAVVRAASLVRQGRIFTLARERFPGMPLFPGHPPFQVLTYRSPQGICAAGDEPWGAENDAKLGYISELLIGTAHSGAHIDALAHMTVGDEQRWHGGSARTDLGDFGPLKGGAEELFPIWTRGILFDVPRHRNVEFLGPGDPVTAADLDTIAVNTGIALEPGDVALIRTGYMQHWPDPERMRAHKGPGPDLSAARWLHERGVIATGTDTETYEVQPAVDRSDPHNPQPVHTFLLIEQAVYLMESLDLEELAAAGISEFLFVALPLLIRGATGSLIDPIAVI